MNTPEECQQKAQRLCIGALYLQDCPLDQAVAPVALQAFIANAGRNNGLPIVYADQPGEVPPVVTFTLSDNATLADALNILCQCSGARVSFHSTGIIVHPPAPTLAALDAEIAALKAEIQVDREGDGHLLPEHSDRLERLTDLKIARAVQGREQRRQEARTLWEQQQAEILRLYPEVGKPGSAASQTFIRAFARVGNDPRKALAVAKAVFDPAPAPAGERPALIPGLPPPMTRFVGGPADGLEVPVNLPGTPWFTVDGYPGACYAAPEADGIAYFTGWASPKPEDLC